MANTSERLEFHLPEGEEDISVTTDLNGNLEKIDTNINFRVAANTAARLAITPIWEGLTVRETDTGNCYVSNGSSPASGSWDQVLTTDTSGSPLVQLGVPSTVYLTSDSERVSTTTRTADATITAALESSSTYLIELMLILEGGANVDASTMYTVPSGATGVRNLLFIGSSLVSGSFGYGVEILYDTYGLGTTSLIWENTVMTTTSAGTFSYDWAQRVSNATATTLNAGTWMRITKLA